MVGLRLQEGNFDTALVCDLIKQTTCLKSFILEDDPRSQDQSVADARSIVDALATAASDTLEILTLTGERVSHSSVRSLRCFESLMYLNTTVAMHSDSDGSNISDWPHRLPPKLEKLTLTLEDVHAVQTTEHLCEAYQSQLRFKKSHTPKLNDVLIRMNSEHHCREAYDRAQVPYSRAGILLHHAHPGGAGHMDAACGNCSKCKYVDERFLQDIDTPYWSSCSAERIRGNKNKNRKGTEIKETRSSNRIRFRVH